MIYRMGGKFCAIQYFEIFVGSTFHGVRVWHLSRMRIQTFHFCVQQPPTKNVKLKTPQNFLPVWYYCNRVVGLLVKVGGAL